MRTNGRERYGIGKFSAIQGRAGKIMIRILERTAIAEFEHIVFQGGADEIERHPDQSMADFLIFSD
jgi:hypothetical protein